ncbi:unnamed protein product [Ectocarpus fasciculatus]
MDPVLTARSKRRGSVLRREALERLRQGEKETSLVEGSGRPEREPSGKGGGPGTEKAGAPKLAWGEEKRPPESGKQNGKQQHQQHQQQQRRRKPSKLLAAEHQPLPDDIGKVHISPSAVSNLSDLYGHGVNIKGSNSAAGSAQRTAAEGMDGDRDDVTETSSQRVKEARERRMSRRRESSLRIKDLEHSSVGKMGDAFRRLYVPPLGPLDDPPGVIYLDGKLTEKTVDSRFLDSVGEGVQEARKELFDLGTRRRSLVEEIRAQNRRVSLGFPRNPAAEDVLEKRAQEADEDREKAESKLKRLLNHRRRLLDVLKASHVEDKDGADLVSKIARSEMPRTGDGAGTSGGAGHGSGPRRSSLADLRASRRQIGDLARELMAREPVPNSRNAATVDCSRRPSVKSVEAHQKATSFSFLSRTNILLQGWREVVEAVFPEEADRRRQVVRFREGSGEADRERKEASIRGFMSATTPREHVEFLIAAMDPARANDLSSVIKCLLLHYTGPAADELDIFLGGRIGGKEVQELLEMSLEALDHVHTAHVPSILMLQWLLGRAPHLRSLLLQGGVVRRAFSRLERAEAKGFGPGERAMQYAALFLATGLMFE